MQKRTLLRYTEPAVKDLDKLDKNLSKRIVSKIETYTQDQPLLNAKRLNGVFEGLYRYRIGDYRAIFEYEEDKLIIIKIIMIRHRKDAYR